MADETVSWIAGIDWGSEKHQVCLLDAAGQVILQHAHLCRLPVDVHLVVPARLLRLRTGPEDARDVQPDVQPDASLAIIHIDHFAAPFYSSRMRMHR